MLIKFERNPLMKEQFIALVDSLGGDNCSSWSQVSNFLNDSYNFNIDKPKYWKNIYESLKYGRWNDFTFEEKGELLRTSILCRGNNKIGLLDFNEKVGKKISIHRYTNGTKIELQHALKNLVAMLSRKKTSNLRPSMRAYGGTIMTFVKACDQQINNDNDNQLMNELITSAKIFEQLLLCYAKNIQEQRPEMFWNMHQVCNRKQFESILYYLTYIHEIKMIYINKFDQEFTTHPLCHPTPKENLKCEAFQRLIKDRDWEEKLNLFNASSTDNQNYKMNFNEQKRKVNNTISVFEQKKQIQTVRGRIRMASKQQFKNSSTIIFDHDDEQNYEDVPVTFLEKRNEKLQELLEEAFRYLTILIINQPGYYFISQMYKIENHYHQLFFCYRTDLIFSNI